MTAPKIPAAPAPLAQILAITPYKGGEAAIPGIAHPIKLSSNENPLGASPAAQAAFVAAAGKLAIYPDGGAFELRHAIGQAHGLAPERIICGSGSDEIFQMLARAFLAPGDEIIQSMHGFLVYRLVAQAAGAVTLSAPEQHLCADVDALLSLVSPRTKILFLANPNNPTGSFLGAGEIARLHAGLPGNVLLVLDEAYAEYVIAVGAEAGDNGSGDYESGLKRAADHENVLVTRTFSKIYGLASLRLGWAFGPASVIDALNRVRGPFNVSAPAMAAGIAALGDSEFVARSRAHNATERARLAAGIAGCGFRVAPSVANFLLADFGSADGAAAADLHFRSRGLIFRAMGAYGLAQWLRISVGTIAANDAVLAGFAALAAVRA